MEGFAIPKVFKELKYLLVGDQEVQVCKYHQNILFLFVSYALKPTVGRHLLFSVQRWARDLTKSEFVAKHIIDAKNVFADILTIWTRECRKVRLRTIKVCSIALEIGQTKILWQMR